MSGYLLSMTGTILLSAILTALIPDGKTAGVIKGITRLACVLVIVAPIPAFLNAEKNDKTGGNSQIFFTETVIQTDENFIKYYSEMRISAAEKALQEEILEKFSYGVEVTLGWTDEDGEIRITNLYVKTDETIKEEDERAMWDYLTKNYCSEVLIE